MARKACHVMRSLIGAPSSAKYAASWLLLLTSSISIFLSFSLVSMANSCTSVGSKQACEKWNFGTVARVNEYKGSELNDSGLKSSPVNQGSGQLHTCTRLSAENTEMMINGQRTEPSTCDVPRRWLRSAPRGLPRGFSGALGHQSLFAEAHVESLENGSRPLRTRISE